MNGIVSLPGTVSHNAVNFNSSKCHARLTVGHRPLSVDTRKRRFLGASSVLDRVNLPTKRAEFATTPARHVSIRCQSSARTSSDPQPEECTPGEETVQNDDPRLAERGVGAMILGIASRVLTCISQCMTSAFRTLFSTSSLRGIFGPVLGVTILCSTLGSRAIASGGSFTPRAAAPGPAEFHEVGFQLGMSALMLLLLAIFSASETSITTLWPWKVRELADKEGEDSPFQLLRQDVSRFLTTILIGSTATSIAATALVTDAAFKVFGEAGVGAVTLALTLVILIFGEIAPKNIAVKHAQLVARTIIRPIAMLAVILYPIGKASTAICNVMLSWFNVKASTEPFVTEEELKLVLRGAADAGSLRRDEHEMIGSVMDLDQKPVGSIMTPLIDVVAIPVDASLEQLREMWVEHQYSRVPMYSGRIDNIIGIVYCHSLLQWVTFAGEHCTPETVPPTVGMIAQTPPYFVPESMSVWKLLREFKVRKTHIAVVVNEYGGTCGIVTLEDAVEEIVGEIYDETDLPETGNIIHRGKGIYDVDAKAGVDELKEVLQIDIPEGRYETVAGYLSVVFGCIPTMLQSVEVDVPVISDEENYSGDPHGADEGEDTDDRSMQLVPVRITVTRGDPRQVHAARFEILSDQPEEKAKSGIKRPCSLPGKAAAPGLVEVLPSTSGDDVGGSHDPIGSSMDEPAQQARMNGSYGGVRETVTGNVVEPDIVEDGMGPSSQKDRRAKDERWDDRRT